MNAQQFSKNNVHRRALPKNSRPTATSQLRNIVKQGINEMNIHGRGIMGVWLKHSHQSKRLTGITDFAKSKTSNQVYRKLWYPALILSHRRESDIAMKLWGKIHVVTLSLGDQGKTYNKKKSPGCTYSKIEGYLKETKHDN